MSGGMEWSAKKAAEEAIQKEALKMHELLMQNISTKNIYDCKNKIELMGKLLEVEKALLETVTIISNVIEEMKNEILG